jgi:prevent-host-death family protein
MLAVVPGAPVLGPSDHSSCTRTMYNTEGVDAIATITELRSETSELIDYVRKTKSGVLIQKNNEPYAVLIDWETYKESKEQIRLSKERSKK